jgi:hypothetical protein
MKHISWHQMLSPDDVRIYVYTHSILFSGPLKTPCWIWTGGTRGSGYGGMYQYIDENEYIFDYAHRFSYQAFNGELIKGMHIMHLCDQPLCVNPKHLKQGTPEENTKMAIFHGRRP